MRINYKHKKHGNLVSFVVTSKKEAEERLQIHCKMFGGNPEDYKETTIGERW